jgi:hypothetical protein
MIAGTAYRNKQQPDQTRGCIGQYYQVDQPLPPVDIASRSICPRKLPSAMIDGDQEERNPAASPLKIESTALSRPMTKSAPPAARRAASRSGWSGRGSGFSGYGLTEWRTAAARIHPPAGPTGVGLAGKRGQPRPAEAPPGGSAGARGCISGRLRVPGSAWPPGRTSGGHQDGNRSQVSSSNGCAARARTDAGQSISASSAAKPGQVTARRKTTYRQHNALLA